MDGWMNNSHTSPQVKSRSLCPVCVNPSAPASFLDSLVAHNLCVRAIPGMHITKCVLTTGEICSLCRISWHVQRRKSVSYKNWIQRLRYEILWMCICNYWVHFMMVYDCCVTIVHLQHCRWSAYNFVLHDWSMGNSVIKTLEPTIPWLGFPRHDTTHAWYESSRTKSKHIKRIESDEGLLDIKPSLIWCLDSRK